jgi:hypothetical protein
MVPSGSVNQNFGFPEGYIPSPRQEGVPTLLHGGEYILNAKAVSRIGIGALNKMNNNLLPKFAKGGRVPGGKRGSASNTRGSADRLEASNLARISKAQNQRNADLKNVGIAKNFIGPIAPKSKDKGIFGKIGNFAKELARPKNSFAMIGGAIGTALGAAGFGVGAVPGGLIGAGIGGAVGEFTEQIFDKSKGFQPLNIAKNAVLQSAFQLGGVALAKFSSSVIKPALMSKFPGVGTYLESKIVKPVVDLFKKPTVASFNPTSLSPKNIIDTVLAGAGPLPAPKQLTAGTSGGGLAPYMPFKPSSLNLQQKQLSTLFNERGLGSSYPAFDIDDALHVFGNIGNDAFENPFKLIDGKAFNPLDKVIKNIPSNPYDLSGLEMFSPAGKEVAIGWNAIRAAITEDKPLEMFGSKISSLPQVDALLYAGSRGDSTAMAMFSRLADLSRGMLSQTRLKKTTQSPELINSFLGKILNSESSMPNYQQIHELLSNGQVDDVLKMLTIVHERPFLHPFTLGKGGDLFLKPTGDYYNPRRFISGPTRGKSSIEEIQKHTGLEMSELLKQPHIIEGMKPVNRVGEVYRNTLHFGINTAVDGHMARAEGTGQVLIANLKAVLDANPNSLDILNAVDTYFTPQNLEGLRIPKEAMTIIDPSDYMNTIPDLVMSRLKNGMYVSDNSGSVEQKVFSDAKRLKIKEAINNFGGGLWSSGQHYTTDQQDAVISLLASYLKVKSGLHANHMISTYESLTSSSRQLFNPSLNVLTEMSDNAISRLVTGDRSTYLQKISDPSSTFSAFKTGGYVPGPPSMAIPALLHGGEYVVNADAVRNMGVRTMQSINQSRFRTPSSAPSYMGGGQTTSVSTVNINVDTFVGEEEWFKSMMKSYNVNVLPKQQKAAGMETRTFTSYNGINQGL